MRPSPSPWVLGCVFCPWNGESKYLLSTDAVYHNDLSDDLLHIKEIDMRFFGSLQECVVMNGHMANPTPKCTLVPSSLSLGLCAMLSSTRHFFTLSIIPPSK